MNEGDQNILEISQKDDLFQIPDFQYKQCQKYCTNNAKTARISGNDSNCSNNCDKLYLECERLAQILIKKTSALNQIKVEYQLFQSEKKRFLQIQDGMKSLQEAQKELKQKDAECAYLEMQLRKKDEENKQLKEELVKKGMSNFDFSKKSYDMDIELTELEFENLFYQRFNQDIRNRLKFIGRIQDWPTFEGSLQGRQISKKSNLFEDDYFDHDSPAHHFQLRKSELTKNCENVYFPVIDVQEHEKLYRKEDFQVKEEFDKMIDTILIELIALQDLIKKLGHKNGDESVERQNKHQTMVISGLVKRLFNQLPVKIEGQDKRSDQFQAKVANLYLLLQNRIFLKNIFRTTLDIDMSQAQNNIDSCVEQILSSIIAYEDFCMDQENQVRQKHATPQKILDMFQNKIKDKMRNFKFESLRNPQSRRSLGKESSQESRNLD